MAGLAIKKMAQEVKAIAAMKGEELSSVDKAVALVKTADEVFADSKRAKAQEASVKDNFKRMCLERWGGCVPTRKVSLYNAELGKKLVLAPCGGGYTINEQDVASKLEAKFGGSIAGKTGKAWDVWESITHAVESPRVLDETALAKAMAQDKELAGIVQGATVENAPSLRVTFSAMTRAENSDALNGLVE